MQRGVVVSKTPSKPKAGSVAAKLRRGLKSADRVTKNLNRAHRPHIKRKQDRLKGPGYPSDVTPPPVYETGAMQVAVGKLGWPQYRDLKTLNALEMLDLIDEYLATTNGGDSRALWDILTALRGPDDATAGKKAWTIAVRRAALPKVAETTSWDGARGHAIFGEYSAEEPREADLVNPSGPIGIINHFREHIRMAYVALNRPLKRGKSK
jgi:hypothetical protein